MTAGLDELVRRAVPGEHRAACPECAKAKPRARDDALAVKIEPTGAATWCCHRCGWKGATGGSREYRPPPRRPAPAPSACCGDLQTALKLYRSASLITVGTVAATYLAGRRCALPHLDGDLRFLEEHRHPCGYVGPALIALITDAVTCAPMTVHRTWLALDGSGKAPVERPRLIWKGLPKLGGVCRLWPDAEVTLGLLVGEGIETVLSAARGFGLGWACLDKANLAALPVLAGLEALTIVADNDADGGGQRAAEDCAKRWEAAGVETYIWQAPASGVDFNDILVRAA